MAEHIKRPIEKEAAVGGGFILRRGVAPHASSFLLLAQKKGTKEKGTRMAR
jgi:hypothetical protein